MDEKTVDMLTKDSVSVKTSKYTTIEGVKYQLGEPHRRAYVNSARGRAELSEGEPAEVVGAVLAMWGETPTITDAAT